MERYGSVERIAEEMARILDGLRERPYVSDDG